MGYAKGYAKGHEDAKESSSGQVIDPTSPTYGVWAFDTNNDGSTEVEEIWELVHDIAGEECAETIRGICATFDRNGDQNIDADGMTAIMGELKA